MNLRFDRGALARHSERVHLQVPINLLKLPHHEFCRNPGFNAPDRYSPSQEGLCHETYRSRSATQREACPADDARDGYVIPVIDA